MIRVCVAGATGWIGSVLVREIVQSPDCELVGAVSRRAAGKSVSAYFGIPEPNNVVISSSVSEALQVSTDVLVDYTRPGIVLDHISLALEQRVHVVIGTSGITDQQYEEINRNALQSGVGVFAAGNFALTAVLLHHLATIAAKYVPHWEIIDYAHGDKVDAPSGTTRELAFRLGQVGKPQLLHPIEATHGSKESRGACVSGSQIHSLRLPGFVISAEVIFGLPHERLTIRHDAGSGADPYVGGTMLAVRSVQSFVGLKRGLQTILEF